MHFSPCLAHNEHFGRALSHWFCNQITNAGYSEYKGFLPLLFLNGRNDRLVVLVAGYGLSVRVEMYHWLTQELSFWSLEIMANSQLKMNSWKLTTVFFETAKVTCFWYCFSIKADSGSKIAQIWTGQDVCRVFADGRGSEGGDIYKRPLSCDMLAVDQGCK